MGRLARWCGPVLLLVALAGCADVQPAPDAASCGPGGRSEHVGAGTRYLAAAPSAPSGDLPVVLLLHGAGSTPEEALEDTGLGAAAERAAVLVVAPEGTGSPRGWVTFSRSRTGLVATEERRLLAVLDDVERRWCTDPARVSAVGISNGAAMAALLGCVADGRVGAVAAVAGAVFPGLPCAGAGAVSLLFVQGDDDRVFETFQAYTPPGCCGGFVVWPPDVAVQRWAEHDGCASSAARDLAPGMLLRRHAGCRGGSVVELVTLGGTGHGWPAGALPDGRSLDELVLAFVAGSTGGTGR